MAWRLLNESFLAHWRAIRRRGPTGVFGLVVFVVILVGIAIGEYLFFSHFLGILGEEAYFATPLLFYLVELFFAVLFLMVFLSSVVTSTYLLFRTASTDVVVVTSISVVELLRARFFESSLLSSWVVLVLGAPLVVVFAEFHGIGFFGGLFLFIALGALMVATSALGFLATLGIQVVARSVGGAFLTLIALAVVVGGGILLARSLVPLDLGDFFQAANLGLPVAPIERIAELFRWWPSHSVGLLFQAVADKSVESVLGPAVFLVGASVGMSLLAMWVARRFYISLWRIAREGSFIAETIPVNKVAWSRRPLPSVLPGSFGAIIEKEFRRFWRDQGSITRALFMVFLMVLYGVVLSRLPVEDAISSPRFRLVVAMTLAVVLYIASTLILQFVFPLLPRERKRGWRIAVSPTPKTLLFVSYALASIVPIAIISGGVLLLSGIMLGLSWGLTFLMVWLGIEGSAVITLVALAIGAHSRRLVGDDAERIATTGPGLFVTGVSVGIAMLLAWGFFYGLGSGMGAFIIGTMIAALAFVGVVATRVGYSAVNNMEFQTGETVA